MGSHRTSYKEWLSEDSLEIITGWARRGLTNEDIAHNIGIARGTLDTWCKNHPKIKQALRDGKETADQRVENRLYKRAIGYKTKEVIKEKDGDGKTHVKTIEREVWPDMTAIIYWLKNRRPEMWKDRNDSEEEENARIKKILLANEKLSLENEKLKEEIKQIKGTDEQLENDGFVEALSASAEEDWMVDSDEEA